MAEAEVESPTTKFFCHKCIEEISPKLPDYVCPRCNCGFIEIVEASQDSDSDSSTDMDFELLDFLSGQVGQPNQQQGSSDSSGTPTGAASGSSAAPMRNQRMRRFTTLNPRHGRRRFGHDHRQQALAPILQEVVMQMTSSILGPGIGVESSFLPEGIEFPAIPMLVTSNLASNVGDYAWGRGGLDAIITQLMNQLDGTGPPPLPQEKINQIPTVKITKDQCDKNLQCTVCMEDFNLDELVRKLNCEHCYHEDCIIPWLQLHGTCPVCRKSLMADLGGERDRVYFISHGRGENSQTTDRETSNHGTEHDNSNRSSNAFDSNNSRLNLMEDDLD